MVRGKKKPKAIAEWQQPEYDSAVLNYPDTDFKLEEDTEINRQEDSNSVDKMSEVDMMHQAFTWISFDKKDDHEALRSTLAEL